jgi:hypothetical protein
MHCNAKKIVEIPLRAGKVFAVERGPVSRAHGKGKMKIADDQRLVRVVNQFGRELPIYDDGFGPLWVHRDSMGISGVGAGALERLAFR